MNLLYLGYWGVNEGLTTSTVFPTLDILNSNNFVDEIILCTIERDGVDNRPNSFQLSKVRHHPIPVPRFRASKFLEFIYLKKKIYDLSKANNVSLMIANGSLAGSLCLRSSERLNIDLVNEYFEPHSDYMLDSKVWSKYGFKYFYLKRIEQQIKIKSRFLVTVSQNYKEVLIAEGFGNKTMIAPAPVDAKIFRYDQKSRKSVRQGLGIGMDAIVGIYVGKFGDIYWEVSETLNLFAALIDKIGPKCFFIILTPNLEDMENGLQVHASCKSLSSRMRIKFVSNKNVPEYLSASDYAFTLVKSSANRKYCAPVKDGEYWANGLPILIPPNIGDDSSIVEKDRLGSIISDSKSGSIARANDDITSILEEADHRSRIANAAKKYRSKETLNKNYERIIQEVATLKSAQ